MVPRHSKQRGKLPPAAAISDPPAETGERRSGRPRATQRDAWIHSPPRLIRTGARRQRRGRMFHCSRNGTAARDRAKRANSADAVREDETGAKRMTGKSQPRFRSAPTGRQASVGCERYLQHRRTLVAHPPDPAAAPLPDGAHPSSDLRTRARRPSLRPPHETGASKLDPSPIRSRIALQSALVSEDAPPMSNQATLGVAKGAIRRPGDLPHGRPPSATTRRTSAPMGHGRSWLDTMCTGLRLSVAVQRHSGSYVESRS